MVLERAAHGRAQRARDEAQQEIAAARQRIEAMRAEQAELGRLRRSRRAAIEQNIARQEEAMERWSTEAEEIAAEPVLDVAPLRIEHDEAMSLLDPDAARVAVLDPEAPYRRELGGRPASFRAREAWTREAVALIGRDAPAPGPSVEPAGFDDVGLDL